jgi:hypothetical protein
VVHADEEAALRRDRQQPLELRTHGRLALVHHHFVIMADEAHPGMFGAQPGHVHPGLPFQRQDAVQSGLLEPVGGPGDVAIRVDDRSDAVLLQPGDDAAVVGQQELVEQLLGEHGPVVVAHVLPEGHEVGDADRAQFVDDLELPVRQVGVDAVHQLGLVIEGVEVALDAKEGAREPEEAVEREPEDDVALLAVGGPAPPPVLVDGWDRVEVLAHALVVLGRGDDPRAVAGSGGAGLFADADPVLPHDV